jgi:hypothetical protein
MLTDTGFIQRENSDSTTDLICLRCFLTVGRMQNESDFSALKLLHSCDPAEVRVPLNYEDRMSLPDKGKKFLSEHERRPRTALDKRVGYGSSLK